MDARWRVDSSTYPDCLLTPSDDGDTLIWSGVDGSQKCQKPGMRWAGRAWMTMIQTVTTQWLYWKTASKMFTKEYVHYCLLMEKSLWDAKYWFCTCNLCLVWVLNHSKNKQKMIVFWDKKLSLFWSKNIFNQKKNLKKSFNCSLL